MRRPKESYESESLVHATESSWKSQSKIWARRKTQRICKQLRKRKEERGDEKKKKKKKAVMKWGDENRRKKNDDGGRNDKSPEEERA